MAPPIKQENLPAMDDCRLQLKNAVKIKLKGLLIISLRHGARFLGHLSGVNPWFFGDLSVSLSGVKSSGRASEAPKIIRRNLSIFLVQFSTWATCLLKFGLKLVPSILFFRVARERARQCLNFQPPTTP
jgi:hypothetical protein